MSKRYTLNAVDIDGTIIGGITSQTINPNIEQITDATNGAPYNYFRGNRKVLPMYEFVTKSAKALIGGFTQGVWAKIETAGDPIQFYLQQAEQGGLRLGGSNHMRHTMEDGLLIATGFSCNDGGDLESTCAFHAISTDGSAVPVIISDNVALPADPGDNERFGLGPITIAGVEIPDVTTVQVNTGITLYQGGTDGNYYATFRGVQLYQPSVTITTLDPSWFDSAGIGLNGAAANHANSSIYFRKRSLTGYELDATAVHIKATIAGMATVQSSPATGSAPASVTLLVNSHFDGTNLPMVWTVDQAIP